SRKLYGLGMRRSPLKRSPLPTVPWRRQRRRKMLPAKRWPAASVPSGCRSSESSRRRSLPGEPPSPPGRKPVTGLGRSRRSALLEKVAPGSLAAALSLDSLGLVAAAQGDLSGARGYFLRAITIQEKAAGEDSSAPGAVAAGAALSLNGLGSVAYGEGDLALAR